jgi:DNA-binding beta-propeller fold protein YncE
MELFVVPLRAEEGARIRTRHLQLTSMNRLIDFSCSVRCLGMLLAGYVGLGSFASTPAEAVPKDTVVTTVLLNGSLWPNSIVMDPQMKSVYVCCSLGAIYGIDTATNAISFTYQTSDLLGDMGISPSGKLLYFVDLPTATQANLVKFSIAEKKVLGTQPVSSSATIPTVSPKGALVYLPDYPANTLRVFTGKPFAQTGVINTGAYSNPRQTVFTADGTHAYVTDLGFGVTAGDVSYIDVPAGTATAITSANFNQPWGLVRSPDGATIYVTQSDTFNAAGVQQPGLVLIDTATNTVKGSISVTAPGADSANYSSFLGIPAITPDGAYLYVPISSTVYNGVTYQANSLAVVDTKQQKVIDEITVDYGPVQVVIAPSGRRAYVLGLYDGATAVTVINIAGS